MHMITELSRETIRELGHTQITLSMLCLMRYPPTPPHTHTHTHFLSTILSTVPLLHLKLYAYEINAGLFSHY